MPSAEELEYLDNLAHPEARARRRLVFRSVVAFIVAGAVILGLRFAFRTQQVNEWVCRNGEWVQVGQPSKPVPKTQCGPVQPVKSVESDMLVGVVPANAVAFTQKGNLVSDLPELEPGKLYLAYDPYGVRVEKIALSFDFRSVCSLGKEVIPCVDPRFDSGLKVRVTGHSTGEYVLVQSLESLGADE